MKNLVNESGEDGFVIRMYRKQELALLYFPDCSKETAVKNLRRWIKQCAPLSEMLEQNGFGKHHNFFLKQEVRLIVEFLGEP